MTIIQWKSYKHRNMGSEMVQIEFLFEWQLETETSIDAKLPPMERRKAMKKTNAIGSRAPVSRSEVGVILLREPIVHALDHDVRVGGDYLQAAANVLRLFKDNGGPARPIHSSASVRFSPEDTLVTISSAFLPMAQ